MRGKSVKSSITYLQKETKKREEERSRAEEERLRLETKRDEQRKLEIPAASFANRGGRASIAQL